MAKNPVEYAEQTLKVHEVHETAVDALKRLEQGLQDRLKCQVYIRQCKSTITDREMVVANDVRAADPEASLAAFERSLKIAVHDDPELKKLRNLLDAAHNDLDMAEATVEAMKATARVQSSRMVELGGLLEFYAVTKRTASKS